MENQIFETLRMLNQDKMTNKHLKQGYLNYKIRRFTMNFLQNFVKEENKNRNFLEKKIKKLEKN